MARKRDQEGSLLFRERPEGELATVALAELAANQHLIGPEPGPEFVATVRNCGILEPVGLIRCDPGTTSNGSNYYLDFGRRRVKAARAVGLETIPAIIYPVGTPRGIMAVVENEARKPNIASDLVALDSLLHRKPPPTERQIREATGLDAAKLKSLQRLLGDEFLPELRQALLAGKISQNVADAAVRRPKAEQQELVERLNQAGKLSPKDVAEIRQAGQRQAMSTLPPSIFATPDAEAPEAAPEAAAPARRPQIPERPLSDFIAPGDHPLEAVAALCARIAELGDGPLAGPIRQIAEGLETERLDHLWSRIRRAAVVSLPGIQEQLNREIARRRAAQGDPFQEPAGEAPTEAPGEAPAVGEEETDDDLFREE